MRVHQFALVALLGLSVPAVLSAQTTSGDTGRTDQGGAPAPGGTTTTTTATQTTSTSSGSGWFGNESRWIASGFVGANYSNNSNQMSGSTNTGSTGTTNNNSQRSADYGASIGYLWRNAVGGEFLASFTPNFQMQNALAPIGSEPNVNSYMANAIGAVPLGSDGQFQPYVSGGFGAITLRGINGDSNSSGTAVGNAVSDTFNPDETRAGGDIGVGLMAFLGNVGVRGDVRYFRAFERDNGSNNSSTGATGDTSSTSEFLPGLSFWRANIGVAFRW